MNKLSSQDRASLIKLASSLPTGSPERKAILAGLKKSAGGPVLVTAVVYGGKTIKYDKEELQEMMQLPGVLNKKYYSASNLPKWIFEAGAKEVLFEAGPGIKPVWMRNPNAKKFPGGGWSVNGGSGWVQVGLIIQSIIDGEHHALVNVRSDDRSKNGIYF